MPETSSRDFYEKYDLFASRFQKGIIRLMLTKNEDKWYIAFGRIDFSNLSLEEEHNKNLVFNDIIFVQKEIPPQLTHQFIESISLKRQIDFDGKCLTFQLSQIMQHSYMSYQDRFGSKIGWPWTEFVLILKPLPFYLIPRPLVGPNTPAFASIDGEGAYLTRSWVDGTLFERRCTITCFMFQISFNFRLPSTN